MRILILTQWYPPEPADLLEELALSLQSLGHEIQVLTGFPNYPTGQLYSGYSLKLYQREKRKNISIVRVFLYPDHSRNVGKRILNYLSFCFFAMLGSLLIKKVDVIFAYHPPITIGIPAYFLSRLWGVPLVLDVQDMWPEALLATSMLNNHLILDVLSKFALWVYHKAHSIRVISWGFRENLIGKGVEANKIYYIPNWVDLQLYKPIERDVNLGEELGMAHRFNVLYAGNMGEAQGLETVIETAYILKDVSDIQFVFAGDGTKKIALMALAKQKGLNNVLFLERYPASFMSTLYALADVLLVHLKDDAVFKITVPHKIYAYMAVAKPIVAALHGDGAYEVQRTGAGISCEPQNSYGLAEVVLSLYRMSPEERHAMGQRGRAYVEEHHDIKKLVEKLEQVMQEARKRLR